MKFAQYEIGARNEAVRNLNRKLQGKKIVWDNPRSVLAYKQLVREGGSKLKYQMGRAVGVKQEAVKAGFKTVEEYAGAQRVLFKEPGTLKARQALGGYELWKKYQTGLEKLGIQDPTDPTVRRILDRVRMSGDKGYYDWKYQTKKETQLSSEFVNRVNGVPIYKVVVQNKYGEKLRDATTKEQGTYWKAYNAEAGAIRKLPPRKEGVWADVVRTVQGSPSVQSIIEKVKTGEVTIQKVQVYLNNTRINLRNEQSQLVKQYGTKALALPRYRRINARLQELTALQTAIDWGVGFAYLPGAVISLIKEPKNILKLPEKIKDALIEEGRATGKLLLYSPQEGVIKIGTQYFLFRMTGKGIKIIGQLSSKVAARLSFKFRTIKKGILTVPSQVKGKTIQIHIGGTVKKIAEPLKKQVRVAGARVTAVSAQADKIIKFLRGRRIVRKPIPNEVKLSSISKKLLKQFDAGTISKKNLIRLDQMIRRETGRAGSLLERSFFADPRGRLRPSRLGLQQQEATFTDIFTGKATFRANKPQVLVFENIKVEAFPKTEMFRKIKAKLIAGKSLTKIEAQTLLKFQLKVSGKFKPIGALTREPEITLAPGEIIKKLKISAVTIINGKKVPIVRAQVVKATKSTASLLRKLRTGKLTAKELAQLKKLLKKETGFSNYLSRGRTVKPRVRISVPRPRVKRVPKRKVILRRRPITPAQRKALAKRLAKARAVRARKLKRVPPKRPPRKPPRRPPKRVPPRRAPPRRPPRRPPGVPPPKKPRIKLKRKPPIKVVKKKRGYDVYARPLKRVKGKIPKQVKVNIVPLTKQRAEDLRNYLVDTSLSRTGSIKKVSGKPKKPKLKAPSGYGIRTQPKFRTYKIRKKKRVPLKTGKVIERQKRLLDTTQERKRITLLKRIAQMQKRAGIKSTSKKKVIRRAPMKSKIRRKSPKKRRRR